MGTKYIKIRKENKKSNWLNLLAVLAIFLALAPTVVQAQTTIRPISDFISQQGTYCLDTGRGCVVSPDENFITWTASSQERAISVDYAGLENKKYNLQLGTTMDGNVIERPLNDGRAEVTVQLHTKNANTWAIKFDPNKPFDAYDLGTYQFLTADLLFGHRPIDIGPGKEAALGDSYLKLVFINTAPGAPLPDFVQIAFGHPDAGQELKSLEFTAQASGTLREAFGVTDGTPGSANVIQTGLFMTGFKGAVSDGFPAERIGLKVVGERH